MKTVYKPWGKEIWLELNDRYCYKRIYIHAGHQTSFQYHNFKRETNYIISGLAEVWLENEHGDIEKKLYRSGDYFNVEPPRKHRVIALSDLILQEVSTPEVDDVIRIEDDAKRPCGKINAEHLTPGVCILAAGLGERLKPLTDHVNKGMIPINNKAIISHIIEQFPAEYLYVIAIGYKGDILKSYCQMAHPDRQFVFITVDDYSSDKSGPGYSMRLCKSHLQRPFYFTTVDCLLNCKVPYLDSNWIGVFETQNPERYSTVSINEHNEVVGFVDKGKIGYNDAFIGIAGVYNFEEFWKQLNDNNEVIKGWSNPVAYDPLIAKQLSWFDTGNLDDLNKAKLYFGQSVTQLDKNNGELFYKINNKCIKFFPNIEDTNHKYERGKTLDIITPNNLDQNGNLLAYQWCDGKTLYQVNQLIIYRKFLQFFNGLIQKQVFDLRVNTQTINAFVNNFYMLKTTERVEKLYKRFNNFRTKRPVINGIQYHTLHHYIMCIDSDALFQKFIPFKYAHGDLQFDNILYSENFDRFTYIDWRGSFCGELSFGDLYYDLAKLYGGIILNYKDMQDDNNITILEGDVNIIYEYRKNETLQMFLTEYEKWLQYNGFSVKHVKYLTGLIYINMAPLHTEKFAKLLYCKSIELLSNDN